MATTESLDMAQQLYVSYYGRPADPAGQTYWADIFDGTDDLDQALTAFGTSDEYTENFGSMTNEELVNNLYDQMFGRDAETAGLDYWTGRLDSGESTLVNIAMQVADGASDGDKPDLTTLNNKISVANTYTEEVTSQGSTYEEDDIPDAQAILDGVDDTDASVTAGDAAAVAEVASNTPAGETFTLTNGSDEATANIFIADMVYTPDGSDRILSLQDEDELTGTEGRVDNTLTAEIGNINGDEATTATVTPELNNIQIVNLEWTGNTTTVDVRYADAIQTLNITKVTADATSVNVNNITTPAANISISDAASSATAITLNYQRGVLDDDETANIKLDDVLAASVTQEALGAGAGIEGFEVVNLNAVNGVELTAFSVNEMETLTITGDTYLDIVALTPTAPVTATEYFSLGAAGIANPAAVGLLSLDASAFDGDLTLDITNSLGGFADPDNSGATVHGTVTGGVGDDVFWTSANIADTELADGSFIGDTIDGGQGDNTIKTTAGVESNATVTNIQTLELRQQVGAQTVDLDAFDDALTSVMMRGELAGLATFTLVDLSATMATTGLTLNHGISTNTANTVNAYLKDASGTDDTIAITVENDLNTTTTFDYTLNFDGDDADGDSFNTDGAVENVTITDNDTESNVVTLTKAAEHTGTITLTGGVAGDEFSIVSSLIADTVDGSAQLSDLRLTVGDVTGPDIDDVDQTINLGSGDDILTFGNIGDFNTSDSITDAGGDDTVRAAFDEDTTLTLTGIENLHIIADQNVELDMAAADVDNIVILADIAADGDADESPDTAEPFNIAGVAVTDIITLNDTNLTELNFFADLDNDDDNTTANIAIAEAAAVAADADWAGIGTSAAGDGVYKLTISDESLAATFNGVTLANNAATDLTVNINASLDDVIYGATAYNLGQLTAHGVTTMDIQISDEDITADSGTNCLTTINNIYAKNMTSLSITAAEDVTLGTVSGAALNNSLTTFDASNVGGELTATVISLGNDAVVTLADGDNVFSALGSAGKDIVITAGDGDNTITGSAQDDEITTGAGNDTIAGDRGDNVIESGAGHDTVTGKDGNDTFDVGSGIDTIVDNNLTGIDATLATNTVSMSGGIASLYIDVDGAAGTVVNQMLAVGDGSDLTLSWTGDALQTASAVLDGRLATTTDDGAPDVINGTANSDLFIKTDTAGVGTADSVTFTGGAGNDVVILTATDDFLTFTGGAGNDAAVGSDGTDIFTGGTGADEIVLQASTTVLDGDTDAVIIAEGDSTASAWDQISGFDASADVAATLAVAATAATNVGGDYLDLAVAATFIAGAVDGTDTGDIESHSVDASGFVTFDDIDVFAAGIQVGTDEATQISLEDALAYLAANIGAGETYAFTYDADGDGALTSAADSTFIVQDGATDTVVELVGVIATGVSVVGAADYAVTTIEIA